MKKQTVFLLLALFVVSQACQLFVPSRPGTVISDCSATVLQMSQLQTGEIPEYLWTTGKKRGDEFDANEYFSTLTHISMREGYVLDYVYQIDDLGGYPLLYPRSNDQEPFASSVDIPEIEEWQDFREYIVIEDTEQGYFDYVVMDIMADQFYLYWHANYNDTQIVCNRQQVYDIVAQVNSGDFGNAMDSAQQAKARTLRNIPPVVRLAGDTALVEIVTFTKWGGFYRLTYIISREQPHTIIEIKEENILPYDCGVMF